MNAVDVRQLQECISFETHLLKGLEQLLETPVDTRAGRRVLLLYVDLLLDELPREFGLKSDGGYLEDVVREYPELSGEVDQLRLHHQALWETLGALRVSAAGELPRDRRQQLREALARWSVTFFAMRHREDRLIQEASNRDVGGEA